MSVDAKDTKKVPVVKKPSPQDVVDVKNCYASANEDAVITLQTAKVFATNPRNTKKKECRILLDTGSHRSYIKRSVSKELGLKCIGLETLQLNTFGSTEGSKKNYKRYEVNLTGRHTDKKVMIEALEIENICSRVPQQYVDVVKIKYPELERLQFADEVVGNGDEEISLLIGLDHYWSMISGQHVPITKDAVAMETIFGYVLSGPLDVTTL